MKKYLDIAKNEKVVIQRGRNETFVLVAQNNAADEDLSRAITVDEVLARVREGLNEMFERKDRLLISFLSWQRSCIRKDIWD
jgi:hypothetical protein